MDSSVWTFAGWVATGKAVGAVNIKNQFNDPGALGYVMIRKKRWEKCVI